MDLPDLQKYKDKFSQQSFIEKIQRIDSVLPDTK